MKWLRFASLIALFIMIQSSITAQPATVTPIPPPDDPLVTRLPGIMMFPIFDGGFDATILLNTMDGTTSRINGIRGTSWSPDRQMLIGETQEGWALSTFEERPAGSLSRQLRVQTIRSPDNREGMRQIVIGWSDDGKRVMLLNRINSEGTYELGTVRFQLEIMDIITGDSSLVLDIAPFTPMNSLFYVHPDYVDMTLNSIRYVQWNPIYPDWIFLQVIGHGKHATIGDDRSWIDAGMYNFQTREYISVTTLFPQTVISTTDWSPDGTKIAMTTMTGISIIRFTVNDGVPRLQLLANGVHSRGQAVLQWLGVGDLLVTSDTVPYRAMYVAQTIGDNLSSQEFFALSSFREAPGSVPNFIFTGTPEQEAEVSCMFFNEVYPPRLVVGARGRVTFTDGTPSRLRAAPGTHPANTVVTQMQEGTSFTVTGTAYCVDGYRWWPIRLDDGTTGWAAEGTATEAWLETVD